MTLATATAATVGETAVRYVLTSLTGENVAQSAPRTIAERSTIQL